MKRNTIILSLYGQCSNVRNVSGRWDYDFETPQYCTYTIENGLATITLLEPVYATKINLPMPFTVPVNDLGSGYLKYVEINCDTLAPHLSTCPTQPWIERKMQQPVPTPLQTLWSDYNGLH